LVFEAAPFLHHNISTDLHKKVFEKYFLHKKIGAIIIMSAPLGLLFCNFEQKARKKRAQYRFFAKKVLTSIL
jgi:hypothetical protein